MGRKLRLMSYFKVTNLFLISEGFLVKQIGLSRKIVDLRLKLT